MPTLRKLKCNCRESSAGARRAAGDFNSLIVWLEEDCVQWYAQATAVFPAVTTNGDLIRGQIPATLAASATTALGGRMPAIPLQTGLFHPETGPFCVKTAFSARSHG